MHHLLLGGTGGNDEDGAVLEVGNAADLGTFIEGDGSVVVLADDEVLERAAKFARELCGVKSTCMSSSP